MLYIGNGVVMPLNNRLKLPLCANMGFGAVTMTINHIINLK